MTPSGADPTDAYQPTHFEPADCALVMKRLRQTTHSATAQSPRGPAPRPLRFGCARLPGPAK